MGFLAKTTSATLNMSRAVVSAWARIPAATAAARADDGSWGGFRVLKGVIPIFMFGDQQTGSFGGASPMQPSCIGVRVGDGIYNALGRGYLDIHLQTIGSGSATTLEEGTPVIPYSCSPYFGNSDMGSTSDGGGHPEVNIDQLFHILISWSIGAVDSADETSYSASSLLYCAINDVDKNGPDLPALWPGNAEVVGEGADPNAMLSNFAMAAIQDLNETGESAVSSVPSRPIWIPGPATLNSSGGQVTATQMIQMAKLQVFEGVTLNTGVIADRRAFITADGTPADPAFARQLLGKSPIIDFRTSDDWINGRNHGTLGNFSKTGTITKYEIELQL